MKIHLNITEVDHEKGTCKLHGVKTPLAYLTGVLLPALTNGLNPSHPEAVRLSIEVHQAGLSVPEVMGQGFASAAQYEINRRIEARLAAEREAKALAERAKELSKSDEQIHEENRKKKAERERVAAAIRNHNAGGGFF